MIIEAKISGKETEQGHVELEAGEQSLPRTKTFIV